MGAEHVLELVVLEEVLDAVGPELDDVSGSVGVADEVGLNAEFLVVVGGVGPENVDDELLVGSGDFVDYLEGPLDCFYLVN